MFYTKQSSVINTIYSGQELFSYNYDNTYIDCTYNDCSYNDFTYNNDKSTLHICAYVLL